MELTEYIKLARKWLWLILIAAFVGGGISFIANTGRPATYTTSTTVSIGHYIDAPNPNSAEIYVGITLAETYAQLVRTNGVLTGTIDALDLPFTPQQLNSLISTGIISGTSLLVLNVTYTDPVLTADIANTLAQQLIERSPSNLSAVQQAQVDYATLQMEMLDQQVQEQRQNLLSLNAQLESATDPDEIARLTGLRSSATEQITRAAAAIAQFQNTMSTIQQRTNAVGIVERAAIPTSPRSSGITTQILLGAIVAAAIAGGVAFLIEYLDDRLKTTDAATQLLKLPVLGTIPMLGKRNASYPDRLIIKDALSPYAEAYRRLQTNLLFASANGRKKVLVITSSGPEEGKSITAANLAATMANDGMRVLLIDADLRRPRQHHIFQLENEVGLSTLLIGNPDDREKSDLQQDRQMPTKLDRCIQPTEIPNLKVITSGFVPSNPAQILRSSLMKRWIDAFRAASDIDIVIIDTPPVLLFGDSTIIATVAETDAVLVVDSQRTHSRAALEAKEQLAQVGIQLNGLILNRVNPRDEVGRYGYDYSYNYYAPEESKANGRRRLFGLRQ